MFSRQVQKQQVSYEWSWWLSTSTQVQDDCFDKSKVWWKQLMIAMIAWNKYYKYSYFCYFFVDTKKTCVIAMIVFKSLTSTRFSMFSWEVLKRKWFLSTCLESFKSATDFADCCSKHESRQYSLLSAQVHFCTIHQVHRTCHSLVQLS